MDSGSRRQQPRFLSFSQAPRTRATLLVGSGATSDGSLIIGRNADSNALKAQHMVVHPAKTNQKGMYRTADHHGANNFEYPLPKNSLRYTTVPNWKTGVHGATGFNSAGVGVSGTESIFARDDALKLDPYVEKTGITGRHHGGDPPAGALGARRRSDHRPRR